jgi:NAD(P)H-hydrate repair Nnr-like enzyme with NAD(P)H-hydrate dehydratase domain
MAAALAARAGMPVAVRGVETAVAAPDGRTWRSTAGSDGLGTAGSGDVFAGVAGGLLAGGVEPLPALGWAVAVHACAGELAAADVGTVGFLAREVADRVPRALHRMRHARPCADCS